MDPRHKLYKTLDNLTIDPNTTQAAKMSARTDDEAERVQATSGVTMDGLKKKLEEGLGATYVEIEDLSGMSYRFQRRAVSYHLLFLRFPVMFRGYLMLLLHSRGRSNHGHRRMRANVRSHYRIATVYQEDDSGTASARQQYAERGDCRDTCLDAKVSYTGRVGEEEAAMRKIRIGVYQVRRFGDMRLDVCVTKL
jgi:hypothetical protein